MRTGSVGCLVRIEQTESSDDRGRLAHRGDRGTWSDSLADSAEQLHRVIVVLREEPLESKPIWVKG